MLSKFIENCEVTKSKAQFEDWLLEHQYDAVSDDYPSATPAITLVNDFLDDYPNWVNVQTSLERHASNIGYVSDYGFDRITDFDEE